MENFLKYILENIVEHKDKIHIERVEDRIGEILLKVEIEDSDKGVVIGKNGKNIQALKNLLNIIARKEGKKVFIKIQD
jgi:predicted RNA-binding protein YlqC (UPF0109 family)